MSRKKQPAWSFSSLTAFETCPKRYYHLRVAKDIVDTPHESTVWGQDVHKHLENRAVHATPLPPAISKYETLVKPILDSPGEKLVEKQFAITRDFRPTGWSSPDTWYRGVVDIGVISATGYKALLLDWKTGKRKNNPDQLKLFAGLAFAHYPEVKIVTTGFVWLKENKIDKTSYPREAVPMIWGEFAPRVDRMDAAFASNKFPPKPSGLCRAHCPVPRRLCEFSGKV
jgi:hypothetical protein